LVASVIEGGPAEQAGVKAGDVIVQFADREVEEMRRLPRIVAETPVGRDVAVVVWRDRQETRLSVAVGELREEETVVASRPASGETTNVEIGLTLSEVTPALRERFELEENTKGVVITDVDASGPAADKDLLPGDVIVEVSQEEVDSPGDLATKVEKARSAGQKSVLLLVESKRGGLRFIALRIEKS
jgi:serine protease Do